MMKSQPFLIPHNEKTLKMICEKINLSPVQLEKDIVILKDWLRSQPHLPQDALSDDMLGAFITGCKNSLQRAKQTIDKYLTNRTTFPDIYSNRDVCGEEIIQSERVINFFPLPQTTPEGYRVILCSVINTDPDQLNFLAFVKRALCSADVLLNIEKYHGGIIYVYDVKGVTVKHLPLINLTHVKGFVDCGENSLPLRTKSSYTINANSFTETLVNMFKPFLKEKTAKRINIISGDHTTLYKHFPKDILPYEYGGKAGKMEDLSRSWNEYVKSYRDWFIADAKRLVDESKRPEKSVYKPEQMFGVEGSFKTLSLD